MVLTPMLVGQHDGAAEDGGHHLAQEETGRRFRTRGGTEGLIRSKERRQRAPGRGDTFWLACYDFCSGLIFALLF